MTNPKGMGAPAAAAIATAAVTAAALIGRRASPTPDHPATRRWYRRLDKPGFTPPAPAYAAAWGGIEAALAYGGYRLLRRPPSPARATALALWGANQIGIAGWSAIFFGRRAPGAGALAAGAMVGTAGGYVAAAAREDRAAAVAGVPLVVWLTFATLLAEEVWRLNANDRGGLQ